MSHRLPPIDGEWIDRTQPLRFSFEGTAYTGYAGDTIASALWAAGERVLGRSFKYHRPRGILSGANHDVNLLMQDGERLNLRADVTPLEAGMELTAVNTLGGVKGDRASLINFFSAFLPVGFYYKTFLNKRQFPFWERQIRNLTGLGKVDLTATHRRTAKRYDFCDVLVVGGGVAGLAAAIAAADSGADVVLVDENAHLGGAGSYQRGGGTDRSAELVTAVQSHPRIRCYTRTVAAAYYADQWIPLVTPDYLVKLRSHATIIATGAYEQPAVFRNNDLPGVMLASAAQRLLYRYRVKPMQRAVVLTANADGYRAALDLVAQGIQVQAVVDLRHSIPTSSQAHVSLLQTQGIPVLSGQCIYEARSNPTRDGVSSVIVCPIDSQGNPQVQSQQAIDCDGVLISVGWAGATNLLYQAGAKLRFEQGVQQFVPDRLPNGVFACGRVNGVFGAEDKLEDGRRTGLEAGRYGKGGASEQVEFSRSNTDSPTHPYPIVCHPHGKNFVDFDEDLHLKDFANAVQEGFDNIELLKRYTTVGMGPSQGKHSNMNALRILARLTGKTPEQVGTTTARPFVHPVPLSHLAGRGFSPERHTPLHSRHSALGAKFMLAGQWRRPEYYAQTGKDREACVRSEVAAVRDRIGLIDVGTLGKLEIWGTDAAEFLERVYTGRFQNQKVGTTRYAVMLDEAGVVIDDGVVARLAPDHFYFTTTTSGAAGIYRELTRLNTIWQLDCGIVNLTGARSAVNLAGRASRAVLAQLTDGDLSTPAFPYLAVRELAIANIAALVLRVGFVGEWGYEIHVATESAPALWDELMAAGSTYGIQPFGVEAQRRLRLEKGHLIVGQDTDGLTTPLEAGLEWAVKWDKPFFVGQRSLQVLRQRSPNQTLVGFVLDGIPPALPQECHLIIDRGEIAGRVTSVAFSTTLDRVIGLAMIRPDLAVMGNCFTIRLSDGTLVNATIAPTPFYDPDNLRQKDLVLQRQEVLA